MFTYALGPDNAQISKSRNAIGWKVQHAGPWGVAFRNHLDLAGKAAEGAVMAQTFIQDGVMNERSTALENLNHRVTGVLASYNRPFTRDDHEALDSSIRVLGRVKNGLVQYANPEDARRAVLASRSKVVQN